MLRLAAALVVSTLVAAPAWSQAPAPVQPVPMPLAETEETPPVDASLVGAWTLTEVEDAGPFGRFGAEIESIEFAFGAEGAGEATAVILQDGESYVRESTFAFGCEDGAIVSADHPTIRYEFLDDGALRLTDASGLAVRLAPADSDTVSR